MGENATLITPELQFLQIHTFVSSANLYVGNISAIPVSFTINGVTIKKKNVIVLKNPLGVRVGEKGVIILNYSSDIGGIMIGGQELWLDNFCFN